MKTVVIPATNPDLEPLLIGELDQNFPGVVRLTVHTRHQHAVVYLTLAQLSSFVADLAGEAPAPSVPEGTEL
jgi:hypothetical protein